MIKACIFDLDGTLTNSRKEITPSTRDALIDIQKKGKKHKTTSNNSKKKNTIKYEKITLEDILNDDEF